LLPHIFSTHLNIRFIPTDSLGQSLSSSVQTLRQIEADKLLKSISLPEKTLCLGPDARQRFFTLSTLLLEKINTLANFFVAKPASMY